MIQRNHVVQPTDKILTDSEYILRLRDDEIREMQDIFGCNQDGSEVGEAYFAEPDDVAELTIIDELEYWERYGD